MKQPNENQSSSPNSFSDIHLLCTQLYTDVELCEHDLIDIVGSVVCIENSTPSDEFKKQEASFLYLQLIREILFRLKFESNAKDEFVDFFRTHYSHNDEQLRIIDDFEKLYRPQQAIRWLIRKYFIKWVFLLNIFIHNLMFFKKIIHQIQTRYGLYIMVKLWLMIDLIQW